MSSSFSYWPRHFWICNIHSNWPFDGLENLRWGSFEVISQKRLVTREIAYLHKNVLWFDWHWRTRKFVITIQVLLTCNLKNAHKNGFLPMSLKALLKFWLTVNNFTIFNFRGNWNRKTKERHNVSSGYIWEKILVKTHLKAVVANSDGFCLF